MLVKLKLLLASLRRLSSRVRAKLARKFASLARGATKMLAAGLPSNLGRALAQIAVAAAMLAGVAAMSGVVKAETGVSENPNYDKSKPAIASDADGDYVVVWQSFDQDGDQDGIYARRYNASGAPQSNEFRVNQSTAFEQASASVAMDASGDFVVVWESEVGGFPYYVEIMARRYNADGAPLGDEFQVNENLTTNFEIRPDVAMDATGDFVVVWDSYSVDNNGRAVAARRFAADGTPQGGQFQVNSYETGAQIGASVAMDAGGDFVVVWQGEGLGASVVDSLGVFGRRFDATGAAQGGQFRLHNSNFNLANSQAAVAMDADGDFAVAFVTYFSSASTDFVFARRFDAAGVAQDATEFQVNTSNSSHLSHYDPEIAMDADGDFVIAWTLDEIASATNPTDFNILVRGFDAGGTEVQAEFTMALDSYVQAPGVAMDADGDYAVVWREYDYDNTNRNDIVFDYDNNINNTGVNAAPMIAGVRSSGDHHQVTEGEQLVHRPAGLVVSMSEQLDEALAEDPSNWSLTRDGVNVGMGNIISFGFFSNNQVRLEFASPLGDGDYVLTCQDAVEDEDGNLLDGDFDGVAGGDFVLNFSVRGVGEAGGEALVNQTTDGSQWRQSIAMDADGNYVVVWQGYASISSSSYDYCIIGRRFSAAGAALGDEFLVNTSFDDTRFDPKVAMNDDGEFVVTWAGYDSGTSYDEIFARTFNADGTPNGGEFRVSDLNTADNSRPDVAMDADGEFVVVWESDYAVSLDIWGRKFDFDGSSVASTFLVNSFMTGTQTRPAVAMDADGAFAVVWSGLASGPSFDGPGISMKRYDSDANPLSGFFGGPGGDVAVTIPLVPIPFIGVTEADVAMDADGDVVVVWTDWAIDISYYFGGFPIIHADVKAQRYTAAGLPVDTFFGGSEIDGTDKAAYKPSVAMDDDGDFVVSFTTSDPTVYYFGPSYIYGLDANVMVRRFAANGTAQGFAVQANAYIPGAQDLSAVACDADGDFVVTWTSGNPTFSSSYSQDGDQAGVYMQRFDENSIPTTSGIADILADENDAPVVVNLGSSFADDEDTDAELTYTVVSNTNTTAAVAGINGSQLGVAFVPDSFGVTDITIRATDRNGLWVEDTFTVTVNEVVNPPVDTGGDDDDSGCVAATTSAAPWGLVAILMAMFGSFGRLVRRKE